MEQLLRYVRDWNTNGKLSHVAQAVLHTLLRRFSSDELLSLKEIKTVRARGDHQTRARVLTCHMWW